MIAFFSSKILKLNEFRVYHIHYGFFEIFANKGAGPTTRMIYGTIGFFHEGLPDGFSFEFRKTCWHGCAVSPNAGKEV
jgi:hypothetical protein